MRTKWVAFLLLLRLAAHVSAEQPVSGRPAASRAELLTFLDALNASASAGHRSGFAALVHFPMTVQASGIAIPMTGPAEFLRYYDSVVNEGVVEAIAQARATARSSAPDARRLVLTDDGALIGGRTIVVRRVASGFRVVQMTIAPTGTTRWKAASQDTKVIAFRRGEPPAKRRGALARGEREIHALHVRAGRLLVVRVDEVQGKDVLAEIADSSGAPLNARAGAGARAWSGRLQADTDVRITVVRHGGREPVLGYLLTVDVR